MIKIVYVIPVLEVGGAERSLLRLLSTIDRKRYMPIVIALGGIGPMSTKFQSIDIPVHTIGMTASLRALYKVGRLYRLLRDLEPDIIHSYLYHSDLLVGLLNIMLRRQCVWAIRTSINISQHQSKRSRLLIRLCAKLSYLLPNAILCCSASALQKHHEIGYDKRKMLVITNGIDIQAYEPNPVRRDQVRKEYAVSSQTVLLGMIARYDPIKNHAGFLMIFEKLLHMHPEVKLLLIGSGVDKNNNELTTLIQRLKLHHAVILAGAKDDIATELCAIDILVNPSLGEGFPNTIIEAMACQVPCVASNVGETAVILNDDRQIYRLDDETECLTKLVAMISMSSAQRTWLGEQSRKQVVRKYSQQAITNQYQEFYEQIIMDSYAYG